MTIDAKSGKIQCVVLCNNSCSVATSNNDNTIKLWDIASGSCQRVLRGHEFWVMTLAVSKDSKLLASGSADEDIRVWDLENGVCLRVIQGHTGAILSISLNSDFSILASASLDQTVRVFETMTGDCRRLLEMNEQVFNNALSNDSATLVTCGLSIRAQNVQSGECRQEIMYRAVTNVVLSNDSILMVSGSLDFTLRLWLLATGEFLREFTGHTLPIFALSINQNMGVIVSGSKDQCIRAWDLESGRCTHVIRRAHQASITSISTNEDMSVVASGSIDRHLNIYIAPFENQYY